MKKVIYSIFAIAALAISFTSCEKDPVTEPDVTEEELITTVRLIVTDSNNVEHPFVYKVENGFGSATQGTVTIDTVKLMLGKMFTYRIEVLNESVSPAADITAEVLSEKDAHLFFLASSPSTGAGSITMSNGSKDNQNLPFNQTGTMASGLAGSGTLTITLLHEPTDKNGNSTAATGGETDAEAVFPVLIQ